MRGRAAAVLTASVLLALTACSQGSDAEAGDTAPAPGSSPATAAPTTAEPGPTAATDEAAGDAFPSAITRELDIDFGSAPYDRIPACHHDGPVTVDGGRATFSPSDPSQELTDMGAEVELTITGAPGYVEIGPDHRSYAAVPFSCSAVGGDAPDGAEALIDSGELFVGGSQDDLRVVGLVTAGDPLTDEAPSTEETGASALDLPAYDPAGTGRATLHSSLRNGDGYRYFVRAEQDGDTDEPTGRGWKNVAWDAESGSVRQIEHVEDFMDSVPRPDETLVVGVDGDDGILPGQPDLDDRAAFDAIADFMGEPDAESSEFAEEGDHRGYRSETKSWGSFEVTYYSPADGEPDWVGTCLAWSGELSDFPPEVTIASPLRMGMSLADYPFLGSTAADHVEDGEAPSLVTDVDGRYTVDVMGGSRTDGMLTSQASGTGCARL